jgi:acyl-CoA thioester hydrolase
VTAHLTDRARFRFWTTDTTRYGDTDRQGHVNNAVFATFCETGRVRLLYQDGGLAPPGCAFVIARLALDFRAELQWNETVEIGTGLVEIRRSSFTLGQGLFVGERCAATAENVLVLMDESTRRATPLPDSLRTKLETWRLAL